MDKKKIIIFKNLTRYIKFFVLLFALILSFMYTIKFLDKVNIDVDDVFLLSMIDSSKNIKENTFSSEIVNYVISLDLINPINFLKNNYKGLVNKPVNINKEEIEKPLENEPVDEPVMNNTKPIVYIYNTHQTEEYKSNNLSIHNIKPNVMVASYMLEEKLKSYGIYSVVEEESVSNILSANNWNYANSYVASKMLMTKAKNNYSSLTYFIDLHRDSVKGDITTTNIGNKSYAKVMFLLGLDNKEYKKSEIVISRLNEIISNKYPGISRGIYKKGGKGVNGIYNQDFSSRCILIEVGGVDNTIYDVSNTIDAIADMLNTYIKEDYGKVL